MRLMIQIPRLLMPMLLLAMAPLAHAQPETMPLSIHERLWDEKPGPVQSRPGAPKLLVIYPGKENERTSDKLNRFAGRVDPPDSTVTLNGEPVKVWPGGTFTGLHEMPESGKAMWTFQAEHDGKATMVMRPVERTVPPPPALPWPLEFHQYPVWPTGEFFLPQGETLNAVISASVGHIAEYRLDENGPWQPMVPQKADPERGGRYMATISPPAAGSTLPPKAQPVFFRLTGTPPPSLAAAQPQDAMTTRSITLESRLRVGAMPTQPVMGYTRGGRTTFLRERSGWTRWGNWIDDTWFPVRGVWDDRIQTQFDHGENGWIESDVNRVDWTGKIMAAPYLGEPEVRHLARNTIELRWPDVKHPPAAVFHDEPLAEGRSRLRITFPGAREAAWVNMKLDAASPFSSYILQGVRANNDSSNDPPQLILHCEKAIWGYEMYCDATHGLRILARTKPDLPTASESKPLAGLRVMIDAGHGGRDLGAIGPSGLLEKDVNLTQAAWLQRELEARGAIVKQTRVDDTFPSLDDRVEMAWRWDPDLFIALHHNSLGFASDPMVDKGPKMYCHYDHQAEANTLVAQTLTTLLAEGTQPRIIRANFRLSRNISLCPVIYTETGFLTHPEDEIRFRRNETIRASATAIAHGITKLFEDQLGIASDQ